MSLLLSRQTGREFVLVVVEKDMCELIYFPFTARCDQVADFLLSNLFAKYREGHVLVLGDWHVFH